MKTAIKSNWKGQPLTIVNCIVRYFYELNVHVYDGHFGIIHERSKGQDWIARKTILINIVYISHDYKYTLAS